MVIVIPMAGESRRFSEAGYISPKYELPLAGKTVFRHAVGSFEHYFEDSRFLFAHRPGAEDFIGSECKALGLRSPELVEISAPTRGQAKTVDIALDRAAIPATEEIAIFNIDTFRPGFRFPPAKFMDEVDGYSEVFEGSGPNWSYVKPDPAHPGRALETAEKKEISNLCCTGLYHFKEVSAFRLAFASEKKAVDGELYVAPLYNRLINDGAAIGYHVIPNEEVVFCGVPAEYESLNQKWKTGDA